MTQEIFREIQSEILKLRLDFETMTAKQVDENIVEKQMSDICIAHGVSLNEYLAEVLRQVDEWLEKNPC